LYLQRDLISENINIIILGSSTSRFDTNNEKILQEKCSGGHQAKRRIKEEKT
jgi:hypothetical protein